MLLFKRYFFTLHVNPNMTNKFIKLALSGTIVLGLGACSDSPESPRFDETKYITFASPQLDFTFEETPYSRAELLDQINEFTVWGYCIPRDVNGNLSKRQGTATWEQKSEFFTAGPDVLNGFKVTVDGNITSYNKDNQNGGASNPLPWYQGADHPQADDYNYGFIAASTTAGSFSMGYNAAAEHAHPYLTFTLPHTSNSIDTELDPAQQPDALIGTKFDQFNNSKVKLSFQHIMTGLRFRFHNQCTATEDDRKDLVIHRVTFAGEFYRTARFDFDKETLNGTVTGDTYSATFVLLNTDQTIAAGSSSLMRHDGDPDGRSVKLLLLPNPHATLDPSDHEVDDWALGRNKQITIEYSISGGEHKVFQTAKDFRLSYIPDPNTLHTANFHFVGDDFVVSFVPDNESMWENGSSSDLVIH